jgi:hypothetical protein
VASIAKKSDKFVGVDRAFLASELERPDRLGGNRFPKAVVRRFAREDLPRAGLADDWRRAATFVVSPRAAKLCCSPPPTVPITAAAVLIRIRNRGRDHQQIAQDGRTRAGRAHGNVQDFDVPLAGVNSSQTSFAWITPRT